MSELDRWDNISKLATAAFGAIATTVGAVIVKSVKDYSLKSSSQKVAQEKLRDANAHLNAMGSLDKIFNKGDYTYWKNERDRLSK